MIPSTLNDLDTARMFWEMARLAKEPVIQQLSKDIKAAKQHKPEWGRPIDKYIHDVVSPDYDSPVPPKGLIQTAIDSVQLPDRRKLTRPSCDTFRVILGLFRDPANLPMLVNTKTLSSCILLLREHTKDTDEPALCYEYGYLCFQVIVLTVQVAMLKRSNCSAFDTFMTMASKCPPAGLPELLSKHTMLQIHLHNHSDPSNNGLSWIVQVSRTPQGRITTLPNVGGMSELDSLFLIKTLWESRKQLSYLVSKAPMHGWAFPLRIFAELLLESFKISRNEATWGYLENLCHRYGLVASEEDLPVIAETCIIVGSICTDDHMREMSNGMKDEEDAQIVVESYIARMTLRPGVEPLPIAFCATLVDFVFREQVCFLGGILVPLIKVGYERIWQELADEKVARDADWGTNLARFIINTMGSTERLFGAEHRFRPTEIEAFVPPLHEIDIVGFLGQALLLPMNLPPDSQIDLYWAMLIKRVVSFAQTLSYSKSSALSSKLFAGEYATWLNTLSHIRLQVLSNPDKDESLRANAQGAELAWVNVGKIFGFSDQARMGKSRKGLPETQAGDIVVEHVKPRIGA
ncbi:hypothetical protein FRC07_006881 [Ceratobasidium sp. 392]|nr:hypothetical protein FRC07_006881 [Ceratobasidium sp. 392]